MQTRPERALEGPGASPEGRAGELFGVAGLIAVAAVLASDPTRINYDAASLLAPVLQYAEGRMPLEGLAGMNPPLIYYFGSIPVYAYRSLGLPLLPVHTALVFSVVVGCFFLLRAVLRRTGLAGGTRGWLLLAFAAVQLATVLGRFEFGQREHLFLSTFLPFLALRAARYERLEVGTGLALLAGVVATFGLLLKPHFLLAPVLVELDLALVHRRLPPIRSPEAWTVVATGFAYAGHIALLPAAYREAMAASVSTVLQGYRAYESPMGWILGIPLVSAAALAGLAAVALPAALSTPERRLLSAFGAFTIAGVVAFLVQRKGWSYQLLPALAGCIVLSGPLVAELARLLLGRDLSRPRLRRLGPIAAAAGVFVASVALAASLAPLFRRGIRAPARSRTHEALLRWTRPGEEVLFLTTSVPMMFPAILETDRRPLGRYPGALMSVAFLHASDSSPSGGPVYRTRDGMSAAERELLGSLSEEIVRRRPRVAFLAVSRNAGCPPGFSFVDYLEAAGFFQGPLSGFHDVGLVEDRWGDLRVYVRDGAGGP